MSEIFNNDEKKNDQIKFTTNYFLKISEMEKNQKFKKILDLDIKKEQIMNIINKCNKMDDFISNYYKTNNNLDYDSFFKLYQDHKC